MAERTLVIIRHAHRDKDQGHAADNGLSKKGRRQAELLCDYLEKRFPDKKPVLLSSPKKRCIETLEPIAKRTKTKIKPDPLLLEIDEENDESPERFAKRVRQFCERQEKETEPLTLACSHGDWIPAFLQGMLGTPIDLKKGAWAEISLGGGKPTLRWLIQSLETL